MRPPELYAFLGLAGFLVLVWLGWLFIGGVPVWIPAGFTVLAGMLLVVRIVMISIRQD